LNKMVELNWKWHQDKIWWPIHLQFE
jgi:hypothetical protein